jgi:ribonuclease HI
VQPLWQDFSQLVLIEPRDDAKRACEQWCTVDKRALFTDASVSDTGTGTALVLSEYGQFTAIEARQAGAMASKNALKAELLGIERALIYAVREGVGRRAEWKSFRIFSDCQKALQAISHGKTTASSRPVLARVACLLDAARKQCPSIRLCWVPAHSGIAGNEMADKCAKEAVATGAQGSAH